MIPEINLNIDKKSNMVICTLAHGNYQKLLQIMRPTVEYYGKKHNIDTIFFTERLCPDRPASWDKVIVINGLLKHYEVVMWLDADTIIVDPEPDIRKEIKPETIMLLCTHWGIQPCCPNCGVWIVKRNPKSTELLEAIWDQTETDFPWEQGALLRLLGFSISDNNYYSFKGPTKYTSYVETLDIKWNSMMTWDGFLGASETPIIEHYCALTLEERIEEMKKSYQKFERRK